MPDIAGAPSSSTMLRWTMLIVVVANMAFIADYSSFGEPMTIAAVAATFGIALMPEGFAVAVCLAVLVAIVFFYFVALWPSRHRNRVYDGLFIALALTSVLASCWIVAFRHNAMGLCAALIAASAALGGVMFVRVAHVSPRKYSAWLRVPFSLYFGATTLALLGALTQWLIGSGVLAETGVLPDDVVTASLAIAAAAGGFVAFRYRDFVYPAVITSSVGAMFITQRLNDPDAAADALIVCIGMLVVVGLAAAALAHQPRRIPKGRASRRRAKVERTAQDEGWYSIDGHSSIMRL